MGNPPCWQVQISLQRSSAIEVRATLEGAPLASSPTRVGGAAALLEVLEGWFVRSPEAVFEVAVQSAAGAEVRLTTSRALALAFAEESLERALTRANGTGSNGSRPSVTRTRAHVNREEAARVRFAEHED